MSFQTEPVSKFPILSFSSLGELEMLYININNNKHYLSKKVVEKYKLKSGMFMPMTGYKILEDDKNEEEFTTGNQEIYQAPQNDNPESI